MSTPDQPSPTSSQTADITMGPPAGLAARHRLPPVEPVEPAEGLHYGWWIVLSAVLSIFVCLGIGRFALGMLLPAMGRALSLDYVQMGWIGTANFIGYLLGALWVRRLLPRHGERRLIAMSLMLIVATMVGVALSGNFVPILILYGCTGLGSGIAMVSSMALVPHWFAREWRGLAVGFLSVGMGLAIILAGWAVPIANAEMGVMGWRMGWGGLAVLCLPIVLFCLIMIRNRPLDKGLEPFGEVAVDDENWVAPIGMARMEAGAGPRLRKAILRLGAVYFLFGATYVVYGTFIVTTLVREHGMAEAKAGQFWIWLGVFSLFCGPLLGLFSDRLGRLAGLCLSLFLQACAYALIALGSGAMAVYFSIALFGLSAFAVPLIMTAAVADYSSPLRAAGIMGTITAIFGVGQILGPILAGVVANYSGSFSPAYLVSASLVALAIAITLTLPDPPS